MKDEYVVQWMKKGDNDLLNAETVIRIDNPPTDTICFHAQQCAEKYLKAYLLSKGEEIIKTHNLRFLIEKCLIYSGDFETLRKEAIILTAYSVETRYPGDLIEYSIKEAKEAIEMAKKIKQFITNKMEDKKCSN